MKRYMLIGLYLMMVACAPTNNNRAQYNVAVGQDDAYQAALALDRKQLLPPRQISDREMLKKGNDVIGQLKEAALDVCIEIELQKSDDERTVFRNCRNALSRMVLLNKSLMPNASAHVNNQVVLNAGLFKIMGSDDEIAFVLAHEWAHIIMDHPKKNLRTVRRIQELKESIRRKRGLGLFIARGMLAAEEAEFKRNLPKHELEADMIALEILHRGGYDLDLGADFLVRISRPFMWTGTSTHMPPEAMSVAIAYTVTHPANDERYAFALRTIRRILSGERVLVQQEPVAKQEAEPAIE